MTIKSITALDLYRRLKLGHNVVLVDIRTQREFEKGHIPGATMYPLEEFNAKELIHKVCVPFPDLPTIYVTGASGSKAEEACQRLADEGYEYIIMLEGGMRAWTRANLPTNKIKETPLPHQLINLKQQMQIAVGIVVTLGTLLGTFVNTGFLSISLLAGIGYIYEGLFETEYLKDVLLKMPWNQEGPREPSFFKKIHHS
jgi:rhodanese-related sulfurtransferase